MKTFKEFREILEQDENYPCNSAATDEGVVEMLKRCMRHSFKLPKLTGIGSGHVLCICRITKAYSVYDKEWFIVLVAEGTQDIFSRIPSRLFPHLEKTKDGTSVIVIGSPTEHSGCHDPVSIWEIKGREPKTKNIHVRLD